MRYLFCPLGTSIKTSGVSTMSNDINPSIYIACLAAYNNGYLHGCWIDATQDKDEIYGDIQKMLAESPIPNAEEWAIHEYDGFGSLEIHQYSSIESVCENVQFIQEHGELGAALVNYYGGLEEAERVLSDNYYGEWDSELDFATNLFDELYASEIPESILCYIDYEAFSYDIFINDYLSIGVNQKVHVVLND